MTAIIRAFRSVASIRNDVAWETTRTTFAILGMFGWMGYITTMNWWQVPCACIGTSFTWLMVYRLYR